MRPPSDAFVALHRLIIFGGRGHYLLMSLFLRFYSLYIEVMCQYILIYVF